MAVQDRIKGTEGPLGAFMHHFEPCNRLDADKIPAISCRSAIRIGCFKREGSSLASSLGLRYYIQ